MHTGALTAVCISKEMLRWRLEDISFYCDTTGYQPILHHDNNDMTRLTYLTARYNRAVRGALERYPETENILIVDSYYVPFANEITQLVNRYLRLERSIVGASIWYKEKSHLKPTIRYYDTLSVKEFRNKRWLSLSQLPRGLLGVTGVGGCFVFPRKIWEMSEGFFIPSVEPQAGGSRSLETGNHEILLDCDCRLWRTHADNPGIPEYPLTKRARVSMGELRRKITGRLFTRR